MWIKKEDFQRMVGKQKANEILWSSIKKNKYNAEKVNWFDSKKECSRSEELHIMQKAWIISDLKMQVPFILQDWFIYKWKKVQAIKYIADFVYNKWEDIIVEDVKGYKTNVYNIKKKMFLSRYRHKYDFIET